jgi:hypothetical protein
MMIPRRPGGGDEAYYTYAPEAACPGLRRGRLLPTKIVLDLEME